MSDRELVERIRSVLREMSMLSEVAAVKLDGDRVSSSGSKSAPPPGVRFGSRDMRELSLATYWEARIKSARGNRRRMLTFLYLAELDLEKAKRRQPAKDPHESREVRERRILDQYDGLTDLEAALAEDCSESYIRKVRAASF